MENNEYKRLQELDMSTTNDESINMKFSGEVGEAIKTAREFSSFQNVNQRRYLMMLSSFGVPRFYMKEYKRINNIKDASIMNTILGVSMGKLVNEKDLDGVVKTSEIEEGYEKTRA